MARGLIAYKHKFTDTTALENTTLVEAGSNNTFLHRRHRARREPGTTASHSRSAAPGAPQR